MIGGSAGALDELKRIAAQLPANLPAATFVTLHVSRDMPSILPEILSRAGPLPARHPIDWEAIRHGIIYVAPTDFHLLVEPGHVRVSRGQRENRHRPAIDPMFRSAARAYGSRVVAVVLSGRLDDSAVGLKAVRMSGGLAIVQDPAEAVWAGMPCRAIEYAGADSILPSTKIASRLVELTAEWTPVESETPEVAMPGKTDDKKDKAKLETDANLEKEGQPSGFACPECHGVLWEVDDGKLLRFRCRVGHAYTASALDMALSDAVEDVLWASLRTLEGKAALLRRMAMRSTEKIAASYKGQALGYQTHAETLRQLLIETQNLEEAVEREVRRPGNGGRSS